MRRDRKARGSHRADGEPRARHRGAQPGGLCESLRARAFAGERAGDHPLARRNVRPGPGRILGPCRSQIGDGSLPRGAGVGMYTGDDFNYAELIAGDGAGYSDALLGIFDAIAPAASAALTALAAGDRKRFDDILAPTVPLSRHIFKAPTRFYKTGVVFMAYLNGLQNHFTMVGGQESARSTLHLAELFRLADAAGLLADPDTAAARMRSVMAARGVAS